jgi:hypothetical protein
MQPPKFGLQTRCDLEPGAQTERQGGVGPVLLPAANGTSESESRTSYVGQSGLRFDFDSEQLSRLGTEAVEYKVHPVADW